MIIVLNRKAEEHSAERPEKKASIREQLKEA